MINRDEEILREGILAYVTRIKSAMDKYGILDRTTEVVIDDGPFDPDISKFFSKELEDKIDNVVDGYIVEHRQSLSSISDRWAIRFNGYTLLLIWVDSDHHPCLVSSDYLTAYNAYELRTHPDYRLTHIWPIKEGFLPIPTKRMFFD